MKPMSVWGVGLAGACLLAGSLEAAKMKVFVFTGQSNSLGTTADPKETDITPGKEPLDEKVPFFWANRSTRAGDGPAVMIGDSAGKIVTLQAQQGEAANKLFWGPEIGFGRCLARAGVTNVLIIKASRGGGGNGFWQKGSVNDHMYRHVVETVNQAVKALPAGVDFEIEALVYVQGESDSEAEAAVAGERLTRLAANLRKELPHAAAMKVLIGGIAAPSPRRDLVREQQKALEKKNPDVRYIDTLDLQKLLYDNLHFNKTAKLEVGNRLAEAWLSGARTGTGT